MLTFKPLITIINLTQFIYKVCFGHFGRDAKLSASSHESIQEMTQNTIEGKFFLYSRRVVIKSAF